MAQEFHQTLLSEALQSGERNTGPAFPMSLRLPGTRRESEGQRRCEEPNHDRRAALQACRHAGERNKIWRDTCVRQTVTDTHDEKLSPEGKETPSDRSRLSRSDSNLNTRPHSSAYFT
ncbi:hypothetical protein E2C01_064719 [Portunus trituberculatus]|uniref:Uncharacterized protein n=1 Tax=Portunus trituberculatus TaxID=210409 RepID=A0A5B7HDT3_PORTR|nr:hypothetical protein [Portunus trituberculatus]